jgi:nucleoside-diphosphate-sugar epimerase
MDTDWLISMSDRQSTPKIKMSSTGRILITGGSGFVGRAVARRFVQNGVRVCAASRSGEPPANIADDWCRSPLIDWAKVDCTDTNQMQKLINDFKPTAYVHTVGALLEKSHYRSIIDPFTNLVSLAGIMVGSRRGGGGESSTTTKDGFYGDHDDDDDDDDDDDVEGNLRKTLDYNTVNRDSLASVVKCVSFEASSNDRKKPPFVFVSAYAAPPLVDQRYIESKREGEEILFASNNIRPIVMRPGFLYSEERDWSMALAGLLHIVSSAHKGPFVGISNMVRNIIPSMIDTKFTNNSPLRVEILADAIVQGIASEDCFGILEGSDIPKLGNQAN